MRLKQFLIAAALCVTFPAVSIADVFSCPSKDKITMAKNSDSQWEARLESLPEGMPALFVGAKYTSDGEYDRTESIHHTDMPLDIHFIEAEYKNDSELVYKCYYEADNPEYKELLITLELSNHYLPDSNKMPLLVENYGQYWKTDERDNAKTCTRSAKDCAFHLPQVAARSKTKASKIATKDNKILAFRVHFSLDPDPEGFGRSLYLNSLNSTEHQFIKAFKGKAIAGMGIRVVDQDFFVDINEYAKAREGQEDNKPCNVHSDSVVKCTCSSDNLISAINSGGHVMLDLFAAFSDINPDTSVSAVTKADCSLFYVPALTEGHEPHKHSHDEH